MNSSDELKDAHENPGGFSRQNEQKDDDRRAKRPLYSTRDNAEVRPYRPRKGTPETPQERPARPTYYPQDENRPSYRSNYQRPYEKPLDRGFDSSTDRPLYDSAADRNSERGFNRPLERNPERQSAPRGNDRYGNTRGNERGNERPAYNSNRGERPAPNRGNDRTSPDSGNERQSFDRSRPRQPQDRGYAKPNTYNKSRPEHGQSSPYPRERSSSDYGNSNRPERGNENQGYSKSAPRPYAKSNSFAPGKPRPSGDSRPHGNTGSKPAYRGKPGNTGKPRPGGSAQPSFGYRTPKPEDAPFVAAEMESEIRLNKFIANAGVCSRREADKLIQAGAVKVNGNVVTTLGARVLPNDRVMFGDQTLSCERRYYVLLNKPKGYVTTMDDPEDRNTVMALTENACRERIFPVGRLDRNTTGLLLLTNDGELAKKLTHPSHRIRKIYHVQLDKPLAKSDMMSIAEGIELDDGPAEVDAIAYVADGDDRRQVGLEIHSGRNRVVRRLFEKLHYQVVKLDRVAFAGLTKKSLPRGKWRYLSLQEINFLKMV